LAGRLEGRGWQVYDWPALSIQPLRCAPGALPRPADFDLVVFVSGNAARLYLNQLQEAGHAARWPAGTVAATVGPASAEPLRLSGWFDQACEIVHPPADAARHDSEALLQALRERASEPRRVLLVRGTRGRDWLADTLRQAGAQVAVHAVYRREPAVWAAALLDRMQGWRRDGIHPTWLLTSAEGIAAVAQALQAAGLASWWAACPVVVTHPKLACHVPSPVGLAGTTGDRMVKICLPTDDALFEAFIAP
jgi:uroporphyrinogen-III synthase